MIMGTETRTPLYGHTSPETALIVEDYPYGFKLRCRIRYWLEFKPKKGWRFCTQTTNPKLSYEKWNATKCSTYVEFGACMFAVNDGGEEQGHVKWTGVGGYAKPSDILQFVEEFPGADMRVIKLLTESRVKPGGLLDKLASGQAELTTTINGVRVEKSESEREARRVEYAADLATWREVAAELGLMTRFGTRFRRDTVR